MEDKRKSVNPKTPTADEQHLKAFTAVNYSKEHNMEGNQTQVIHKHIYKIKRLYMN